MKEKIIKCFRFVDENLKSQHGKIQWEIGKWIKHDGNVKPCKSGFHACLTAYQNLNYINGTKFFMAEARGTIVKESDKFAASEMRLVKEIPIKVFQYFALRCAKRVLKYYTKFNKDDNRVADCIRLTEEFLDGKIHTATPRAAADAVCAAARAAYAARAAHAARAAADAAYAARAAADAADAVCAAAHAARAARAAYAARAARAAAHAAECKWQEKTLKALIKEYTK